MHSCDTRLRSPFAFDAKRMIVMHRTIKVSAFSRPEENHHIPSNA